MLRIIVFGTSGPAKFAGIDLKILVYFPAPELAVSKQSATEKRQREGGACMLQ
jgi:hypothetical protein